MWTKFKQSFVWRPKSLIAWKIDRAFSEWPLYSGSKIPKPEENKGCLLPPPVIPPDSAWDRAKLPPAEAGELYSEFSWARKFNGWCQIGYQASPIWTSSISYRERGLNNKEWVVITISNTKTNKIWQPKTSQLYTLERNVSSLLLQKEKFGMERRKDNDDALKKTKGEFVMKHAFQENGPHGLRRGLLEGRWRTLPLVSSVVGRWSFSAVTETMLLLSRALVWHAVDLPLESKMWLGRDRDSRAISGEKRGC